MNSMQIVKLFREWLFSPMILYTKPTSQNISIKSQMKARLMSF